MVKSYKLKWRKFYKVAWTRIDGVQKNYFRGMKKGGYLK